MVKQLTKQQTACAACPLKKLEVFRAVTPEEMSFIAGFKAGEFVTDAGALILSQGANSAHLFTVLSGWGFRHKTLADGRRQILNFVLPGDFIGLQGSMLNEMQHSVEALTEMVLCVFPREKLWSLYTNHPSLSYDLTWLASRSEHLLDENLLSVGRRTALERLSYVLLDVFRRCRQIGLVQNNRFRAPFNQQHLADSLGLSLVHTNKTLKVLFDRNIIRWKGGQLTIADETRLAELARVEGAVPALRPLI